VRDTPKKYAEIETWLSQNVDKSWTREQVERFIMNHNKGVTKGTILLGQVRALDDWFTRPDVIEAQKPVVVVPVIPRRVVVRLTQRRIYERDRLGRSHVRDRRTGRFVRVRRR